VLVWRAFHLDHFVINVRLFHFPFTRYSSGLAGLNVSIVQIQHVRAVVRETPRDAIVVPDDHQRPARKT